MLDTLKSIAPELDVRDLKPDQPLRHQVDLDSLDWMNVVAGLHEKLQVDITAGDYGGIATLNGLVACVSRILAAPSRPGPQGHAVRRQAGLHTSDSSRRCRH